MLSYFHGNSRHSYSSQPPPQRSKRCEGPLRPRPTDAKGLFGPGRSVIPVMCFRYFSCVSNAPRLRRSGPVHVVLVRRRPWRDLLYYNRWAILGSCFHCQFSDVTSFPFQLTPTFRFADLPFVVLWLASLGGRVPPLPPTQHTPNLTH